jgi:hypothetical protein
MTTTDKVITLNVSVDEVNLLLAALAELPLKISKPLFDEIELTSNQQWEELNKSQEVISDSSTLIISFNK